MTDVLDTPPAPTEGEAGPLAGGNGLVDAPLSPFDYAVDDEEVAEGPDLERSRWWQSESNRSLVQLALSIAVVGGCVVYVLVNIHANLILQGQHADRRRLGRPRVGAGLPAGPHPPALAALGLGPRLVRRVPHVPVLHGGAGRWSRCCSTSSSPTAWPSRWSASLGLVALPVCCWAFGKLAGLPFPIPPLFAIAVDVLPLRRVVPDLRRQRRVDDGGGVLLQPRPVHVDAVPRRARPGHADGEGARPRGRPVRLDGPLPPHRRHLRARSPPC